MKKLLAAILGVGVLTVGLCISAAAEDTEIRVGSGSARPGESVSIPITLSGNPGTAGMTISINYDRAITLTGCELGEALAGLANRYPSGTLSTYPYRITYADTKDDSSNGTLATLTFTLPDDASGSYSVTVTVDEMFNNDDDDIAVSVTNGSITVQGNKVSVVKSGSGSTRTRTDETFDKVYSYTISVPSGISITSDDINVTIGGVVATKRDGFAAKIGTLTGGDAQFTAAITKIPKGTDLDLSAVECSVSISYILDGKEVTETNNFTLE